MNEASLEELGKVIAEAKRLAIRYRELTGKPLGITGEVAEYEAARLLGLRLQDARQPGYDAVGKVAYEGERIEIKGRCLPEAARTQRIGRIKLKGLAVHGANGQGEKSRVVLSADCAGRGAVDLEVRCAEEDTRQSGSIG